VRKAQWLRALGEAADAGALDATHLRSLAPLSHLGRGLLRAVLEDETGEIAARRA
jgi:hypothetical protein